ncbi:MAG: bifunctional methylenetetrahydrofolate dehydrogenase/methenyltetrahydrofolate cyclohydrolase FolD [Burkholderiales bacterium]
MLAKIIDGVALSRETRARCGKRLAELRRARGITPGLAVIAVGDDPASHVYVRNKRRSCAEVGLHAEVHEMRDSSSEAELLERIRKLNTNPRIHGILVQLPLPAHIASARAMQAIAPEKDVDGFHPVNVGLLATGTPRFSPCTPAGVMTMLESEAIRPEGRHAVILGRSNIVGKPMAMLLLRRDATVSVCHSKTPDVAALTRQADILVVAAGRPAMVTGDMVKEGSVVIDVGINRRPDGSIVGDVEFASAVNRASHITPVPGGVGPMTIAMLLQNTISAAEFAAAGR